MSSDSTLKKPLLPEKNINSSRKRRFRRCKSAPRGDFVYNADDIILDEMSIPPPEARKLSIFRNLNPSLRRVLLFLVVYLSTGTICFYLVRDKISGNKTVGFVDALYLCIVTMTTVGYGDLVPSGVASQLIACAFVFSGMVLVGHILSEAADHLVAKQETLLIKAFNLRKSNIGPNDILKEIRTNRSRYKCYVTLFVLVILVIIGIVFLVMVEDMSFVDALYCVCSTITTLGYGDKSFSTETGRVFAVFWILTSTICLAQFLLYVAEAKTESKQRELVKWVLTRRITNSDLEVADLDDDGVVGAAEFIIYKLKEMGKIDQEDISAIMEEFEQLDVDESGTLTASDIVLAQTSQTRR